MKHQHEYKDWILPQRVFPSKEREDKTMRDVIQIFIHGSTQLSTRTSWTSGRLWAKSRRTALRTKAPSEHSFQKEVRTSAEEREPRGLAESSRQADVDKTAGHRRHKTKTVSRRPRGRSSILWRKQTTGDMHLSCSHPSEATTHIASDCKAKNYDVQPLRKGSVDHKRLRNDHHRFPLKHWKVFAKASNSTFFFFRLRVMPKQGEHVGRFSNWNITLGARAINARSTFHQFHKDQGTPLLQSWAGNELSRNTSATLTR